MGDDADQVITTSREQSSRDGYIHRSQQSVAEWTRCLERASRGGQEIGLSTATLRPHRQRRRPPSERARLVLCMPCVCTFLRAFNRSNTAGWTLGLAAAPVRPGSRNSATVRYFGRGHGSQYGARTGHAWCAVELTHVWFRRTNARHRGRRGYHSAQIGTLVCVSGVYLAK